MAKELPDVASGLKWMGPSVIEGCVDGNHIGEIAFSRLLLENDDKSISEKVFTELKIKEEAGEIAKGLSTPEGIVVLAFAQQSYSNYTKNCFGLTFLPVYDDRDGFGRICDTTRLFVINNFDSSDLEKISLRHQRMVKRLGNKRFPVST